MRDRKRVTNTEDCDGIERRNSWRRIPKGSIANSSREKLFLLRQIASPALNLPTLFQRFPSQRFLLLFVSPCPSFILSTKLYTEKLENFHRLDRFFRVERCLFLSSASPLLPIYLLSSSLLLLSSSLLLFSSSRRCLPSSYQGRNMVSRVPRE